MSENIPFPYISYKGKKYADPHAAAKAFLLDTTKKQTDTLNIHDISDTSSIDGAGVDVNGKIWTNNYSFQDHPYMSHLKTAMKDVFSSIKEVMARDNITLAQVSKNPLSVRPFYAYNGQRYENPEDALSALYNDPNKSPSQSSLMYHNRFDFGGIELAGVGPNNDVWYTQLSEYNNTPAVAAGRAIFNKMITEAPVVAATNSIEVEAVNKVEAFKPHFSFDGKTYESGKEAMQAFLDKPEDKRYGGVMLHDKDSINGYQMTGQADNLAKTVWIDQMSTNPKVVAARKEMSEVLDAHNVKFPPMDPYLTRSIKNIQQPADEIEFGTVNIKETKQPDFPYFKYDNKVYSSANDVMKVFIADRDNNSIKSDVFLHTDSHFSSAEAAGHERNGNVWKNQYSFQDHPAMKEFSKAFDKQVNGYKDQLKYLDEVYADTAKMVDGYPRSVQIDDMKEMKKIIDKLPIHNVSDSDMIKIQSYKNDIKSHELSVFLDDGTKNNDVKIKNTNALKIS